MHSERANEAPAPDAEQGKLSFVCDGCKPCCQPGHIDADFLNDQLRANGIVLTKLQIPQWSPNIFEQAQNTIINTFCLGQQPVLGDRSGVFLDNEKTLDGKQHPNLFDHQSILGHLKRASIVPINSGIMANYNTINGSDATLDSSYSIYHINNGYISSDAQSLDYNNDYGDQNPHQSQLPITDTGSDHDDSTKAAVKELFFPVMFSGFGNMGAGIILASVQDSIAFKKIPQLTILVPALLGLKGRICSNFANCRFCLQNFGNA